jgi:hypothetical protein
MSHKHLPSHPPRSGPRLAPHLALAAAAAQAPEDAFVAPAYAALAAAGLGFTLLSDLVKARRLFRAPPRAAAGVAPAPKHHAA